MNRLFWLLLSTISLFTCQKREELSPREYPRLSTQAVTDIDESGATFRAELLTAGRSPVTEYGFVWNENSINSGLVPTLSSTTERLTLTGALNPGPFEGRVDFGLRKGAGYMVRAYVRTNGYTVYGTPVRFGAQGCLPPRITSFAPKVASWGDTLVIEGERFSSLKAQLKVYFVSTPHNGQLEALVLSTSNRRVVCIVPTRLSLQNSKTNKIQVVAYGQSVTSQDDFNLDDTKPVITRVSPETGTFGDRITITGSSFSMVPDQNRVLIGGLQMAVITASKTQLLVEVPLTVLKKSNQISMSVGNPNHQSNPPVLAPGFFVMKGPRVTALSTVGETLTLLGENFSPEPQTNLILVGHNEAVVARGTATTSLSIALSDLVFPQSTTNFNVSVTATEQTSEEKSITLTHRSQWVKRATERTAPFADDFSFNADKPLISFVVGGKAYMVLGAANSDAKSRLYEYIPASYTWQKLANAPSLTSSFYSQVASFVVNGKAYVIGSYGECWEYDPATDRWKRLLNGPTCAGRYLHGFALNGKGYVVSAKDACSGTEYWEYDPASNQWTAKKGGPNSNWILGAYQAENRAFVLARNASKGSVRLVEYVAATDAWVEKAGIDTNSGETLMGFWINNQLVLTSGERTYRYDPNQNRWASQNSRMGGPIYGASGLGFGVGNQGFLFYRQYVSLNIYGRSFNTNLHFWEFDPTR